MLHQADRAGFAATVAFILESGPAVRRAREPERFHTVIGGELGVRHLQTAARLRALGLRGDTNISRDLEDVLEADGRDLPAIEDERGAGEAAETLAEVSVRVGEAFARELSSLEAMIAFVQHGGQTTRDELFEAIFVPVALAVAGRSDESEEAIALYRSRLTREAEREEYESFLARLDP